MYLGDAGLNVNAVLLIGKCETFRELCHPLILSFLELEKRRMRFMVKVPGI